MDGIEKEAGEGQKTQKHVGIRHRHQLLKKTFVIGAIINITPSEFLNVLVMILNLHFKQVGELKGHLKGLMEGLGG